MPGPGRLTRAIARGAPLRHHNTTSRERDSARMQVLFIHQNFPAQFVHLSGALAARPGNKIYGLGENQQAAPKGVLHARYPKPKGPGDATHRYLRATEGAVRRAQAATQACWQMRTQGVRPDVIYCHPGWGEGLYLRDVFPDARILHYCEYYYRSHGGDVGFEPGKEVTIDDMARVRTMNFVQNLTLETADWCTSPTLWQRSCFPGWVRSMTSVLHEGVNPTFSTPDGPRNVVLPNGSRYGPDQEIITVVSRQLEPYRGFGTIMRALPEILARRPNARVLMVGSTERGYGPAAPEGKTWKDVLLEELGDRLDTSRVDFVGRLPHEALQAVFRLSSAHLYLTYPFVLSWSMVEAMGCGALIIGSDTTPVQEVIRHGENGLLTPFFDHAALAETVVRVLEKPEDYRHLRAAARQTVLEKFHLQDVILPRQIALIEALANGRPGSDVLPVPAD